ncbi:MAG: IS66 family transposase [Desulfobacteraceae bacterium]|jgi:transposase|nr:IS66 family transposase [Desulfobacteraceae bacterium]
MNLDLSNLPDDAAALKEIIFLQQEKYQEKIDYLEQMVRLLQKEVFGRKSEKHILPDPEQRQLFDPIESSGPADQGSEEKIVIPEHTRKKRGRKPLPAGLPRVDVIHDIAEEDKQCACGVALSCIGQDVSEKLDYVPAKLRVIRHIRLKYACKNCEGVEDESPTVKIAPVPVQLLPKSIASEGLIAHLIVSKFADGLPLYRQQKIFGRMGIELSRATMANWVVKASQQCRPLMDLLEKEIRSGPLINADETPYQVLNEPGRHNTSKSYMWVFKGGREDRPVLLYQYHRTRSGDAALNFLKDYQGYIQSDAFSGYECLSDKKGITHVGCWAHARRYFVNVVKAKKKNRSKRIQPKSLADEALEYIGRLYQIEKEARANNLDPQEIYQLRQEKAKPVLTSFKAWLDAKQPITPPKGLLGKAISYTLKHWEKLTVYVEDGLLRPDNNAAENAIRPFVVGRKNWLFAGHPNGAEAGATFYSLVETAKANGLEPYNYLRYIFEKLPLAQIDQDYENLLPQFVNKEHLAVT